MRVSAVRMPMDTLAIKVVLPLSSIVGGWYSRLRLLTCKTRKVLRVMNVGVRMELQVRRVDARWRTISQTSNLDISATVPADDGSRYAQMFFEDVSKHGLRAIRLFGRCHVGSCRGIPWVFTTRDIRCRGHMRPHVVLVGLRLVGTMWPRDVRMSWHMSVCRTCARCWSCTFR